MAEIKHRTAYDGDNNLVDISGVTDDDRKSHSYHCIVCGGAMIARLGGERARHFSHASHAACDGETYLHKLAKLRLKEKFDTSEHFRISYKADIECDNDRCRLRHTGCTKKRYNHIVDLKDYYDTASIEEPVGGFVADVLLTNSKDKKLPPVLLEIRVTHECEIEKKESGLRIIELRVKDESDIKRLVTEDCLHEYRHYEKNSDIDFYSFNRKIKEGIVSRVDRYVMTCTMPEGHVRRIPCAQAGSKLVSDSLLEINAVTQEKNGKFDAEKGMLWMLREKGIRRCGLCQNYNRTDSEAEVKCTLDSKFGTPKYPRMTEAEKCGYFREREGYRNSGNGFYVEEVTSPALYKTEFKVAIVHDADFDDYEIFQEKCDYYLKNRFAASNITLIRGFSMWNLDAKASEEKEYDIDLCYTYAHDSDIRVEDKDGMGNMLEDERTFRKYCEDLISISNAAIVFWNGESKAIGLFIETAGEKGFPVRIVDTKLYSEEG